MQAIHNNYKNAVAKCSKINELCHIRWDCCKTSCQQWIKWFCVMIWMELKRSLAVFLNFRAHPAVIQAQVERSGGWRPPGSKVSSTSPATLEIHQTKPTTNKRLQRAKPNNYTANRLRDVNGKEWKKERKTSKGGGAWRPAMRCLNI